MRLRSNCKTVAPFANKNLLKETQTLQLALGRSTTDQTVLCRAERQIHKEKKTIDAKWKQCGNNLLLPAVV